MSTAEAMQAAGNLLSMMVTSTLADTARSAASIGTAMRPNTGYVRIVHGDACDRCMILAGKWYRWNDGFLRHPNCLCSHEPVHLSEAEAAAQGMFDDPYKAFENLTEAEQDRIFGKDRAQAIRDGADIFQVVNSKKGMTPNGLFTTAGTTRRGYAGQILKPGQRRATPELIYRWAGGSKSKAQELLREHGYILPGGQNPLGSIVGRREGYGELGRGGTRKAAREAIDLARATGVRDPSNRYTMTAAERRLYDAERAWSEVLAGRNPYASGGFGNIPDPHGLGLNIIGGSKKGPLTPEIAATAERRYLWVLTDNYRRH
nr:MAG TPA_asm: minor capsid protein [Caudoviricetes sp.]